MQIANFSDTDRLNHLKTGEDEQGLLADNNLEQKLFQIAHDVRSPLTALLIMAKVCDGLEDKKRTALMDIAIQIQGMMDSLLSAYKTKKITEEPHQTILFCDFMEQIFFEKRYQYFYSAIRIETSIAERARSALIRVQPNQVRRAISNLFNNAADALEDRKNGKIIVTLGANKDQVQITIKDNGKGMSSDALDRLSRTISFTEGKPRGHGLGMMQVWNALECNSGKLTVQSKLGKGTSFRLIFPRA